MRIGYPCLNRSLGCTASRTFRLASYSPERLRATVRENLECLGRMLEFNIEHGLGFLRISSDLVPFASHPVCRVDWAGEFASEFRALGRVIRRAGLRISMHPDQFVLLNARVPAIVESSIRELSYHARVLDALGLDRTARIQIHVGGMYGDREGSIGRFLAVYPELPLAVRRRLVIENDDRCYPVADCLRISRAAGIPVLFDTFHHELLNHGEPMVDALRACGATWRKADGVPMIDFSHGQAGLRRGAHAASLDLRRFRAFLNATRGIDCDVMFEIKDKEKSARRALRVLNG